MLGHIIRKYRFLILILTACICIISILLIPKLKTEVNFKYFFPKGEPELAGYESFTNKMGTSENLLIIAIQHSPNIFDSIFLQKAESFEKKLKSIPGITSCVSLLSLNWYRESLPGVFQKRPYIQATSPKRYAKDSTIIFNDFPATQHFISSDRSILKIHIRLQDSISLEKTDTIITEIDHAAANLNITGYHMLGRRYMESEYKKIVAKELKTSLILSTFFVALILAILHRSFAGVVLPLLCMVVSLVMLYGYLALLHRPLTIMSNLFPTIILIVGISDVIHISSKFAYECRHTTDNNLAITKTLNEIGFVTFLNSLTTAAGFLTLLTVSMQAIQSFGVDAAVGLLIAWLNSVALLPALLSQFNLSRSFSQPIESPTWNRLLTTTLGITKKYPKIIIAALIVLLAISCIGLSFINTNNKVLTSLPDNNRLRKDYEFFDSRLHGGRSFEMMIMAGAGSYLHEQKTIVEIEKLEQYLLSNGKVTEIVSPVIVFKWLNKTLNNIKVWKLPNDTFEYARLFSYSQGVKNNLLEKIIDSSATTGRLNGRIKDIGRKKMESFYKETYEWINQNTDTSIVHFTITGSDYMTDIGHKVRIENMAQSFCIEIFFVSLIIGFIYRSGLLVVISFIANMIPVIITGGILGFTNFELRGATTIVFAIGYVIAVDASLHFINRFKLEKRKKKTTAEALEHTYLYTGRAMAMTSMILLGGFLILLHSSFGDVFVHGLLMSLIILTSVFTELFITPVLIHFFYRNR